MTLRELKYFVKVYQLTSIVKASEQLYVVPSVVSNAIKKLEMEFNVKLFNRSANRLTSTREGDLFYECALEVLAAVSKLENVMKSKDKTGEKKRKCNLAISKIILAVCGEKIYDGLTDNYKDRDFMITSYIQLNQENFFENYDVIVFVSYYENIIDKVKDQLDTEFTIEHLHSFPVYIWVSKTSPLANQSILDFEMLKDYQFIIYDEYMRYVDILNLPINQDKVINIKIKNQLVDIIENQAAVIVDIPLNHGKLQFEKLFEGRNIIKKKLIHNGGVDIVFKHENAAEFIPLISLIITKNIYFPEQS